MSQRNVLILFEISITCLSNFDNGLLGRYAFCIAAVSVNRDQVISLDLFISNWLLKQIRTK